MKGDFTRSTFKKKNHYTSVRMQQGRVQTDADWNEQQDIINERFDSGTGDIIGPCGAPMHHDGFQLAAQLSDFPADKQSRPENQDPPALIGQKDFLISGGHYYVNGILCINEQISSFKKQAHKPAVEQPGNGKYLAYLDVWQYHLTALEDPGIREVALGGPDTATRVQNIWQVKLLKLDIPGEVNCLTEIPAWNDLIAPASGTLAAMVEEALQSGGECSLNPTAGYRRLENQLYRVEVHQGGDKRKNCSFKWSRDNGSVLVKWEKQQGNKLTVSIPDKTRTLSFASKQWIELTDDTHELRQVPGTLVQIDTIEGEGDILVIDAATADGPTNISGFSDNPKIRRWDMGSGGVIKASNQDAIQLEDGIEIKIREGSFRTGDYWLIPARTDKANIEWPLDENDKPAFIPPHGVDHDYCKLGIIQYSGGAITGIQDCRKIFPPVTELTELFYVGGDGQEAMPGKQLAAPLQVGVSNGKWPVAGATVRFMVKEGGGKLMPGSLNEFPATTNSDGIAFVSLRAGSDVNNPLQQVEARLHDAGGKPVHIPVRFNANLSLAKEVYFDPGKCHNLKGIDNVQEAITILSAVTCISPVGGNGQGGTPGSPLEELIIVKVTNKCGPVENAEVVFEASDEGIVAKNQADIANGKKELKIKTDSKGIASCAWQLGPSGTSHSQQLKASLTDVPKGLTIQHPNYTLFTANILRQATGASCSVIIGPGMEFTHLFDTIMKLLKQGEKDISICMMPGEHRYDKGFKLPKSMIDDLQGSELHLKVRGSGMGTRIICNLGEQIIDFNVFRSVILEDLTIKINAKQNPFSIVQSEVIELRSTNISGVIDEGTLISLDASESINIENSSFKCTIASGMKYPSLVMKEVSAGLYTIFDKFDGTDERKFTRGIEKEGRTIAGLTLADRKRVAKKMNDAVASMGDKLSTSEKEAFEAVNTTMTASRVNMNELAASIVNIRDIARRAKIGDTLALFSQTANIAVSNNKIAGSLCLLGLRNNANIEFTPDEMGKVQKLIKEGMVEFTNSKGRLTMVNNEISRLVLAQYLVENLKSIASASNRKLDRIYQSLIVSGNTFLSAGNQFIGETAILHTNNFRSTSANTGYVVGSSAVFSGNIGVGDTQLFNLTRHFEKTANVLIKIVP